MSDKLDQISDDRPIVHRDPKINAEIWEVAEVDADRWMRTFGFSVEHLARTLASCVVHYQTIGENQQ